MSDDVLILPPQRDLPPAELARRKKHLISEARAEVSAQSSRPLRWLRRTSRRRVPRIAIAATLAVAVLLSIPAVGVAQRFASWLADLKGPGEPVPTAGDVLIASGVAGVPWMLIATPSDQGLCLFLMIEEAGEEAGLGGCGWDSALRGAPSATAPLHWVEGGNGSGGMAALDRIITWGVSAEAVAQIDLVLTDGRTVHANLVEEPEGLDAPLNFYWALLPVECPEYGCVDLDPVVHQIIALDATGEVLERRVVDEPKG